MAQAGSTAVVTGHTGQPADDRSGPSPAAQRATHGLSHSPQGVRQRQTVTYLTRAASARTITRSLSVVVNYNLLVRPKRVLLCLIRVCRAAAKPAELTNAEWPGGALSASVSYRARARW
jgi:hypothetical protein